MIDTQLRILLVVVAVLVLMFLSAVRTLRKQHPTNRFGYAVFSIVLWIIFTWTVGNVLKGI